MADYKYEEHECPMCDHRFVVGIRGIKYAITPDNDTPHIKTKCPKCDASLFISSHNICGVVEEFIPEENIRVLNLVLT